ncbi:MAG: thermonuclease family protein [Pseudomonadota bacterium]
MPKQTTTRHRITPAYLLLTLLLALHFSSISADNYYRWQDNRGNPYFGDAAPENAVNPQLVELNLQQPLYVVQKIIDGDTIVVQHAGKVRLLGINTPEIAHRDRAEEPLGKEAHQRLKQLLAGNKVYLEFDQRRRDKYKRLLAHVRLEDGTNINEVLLREGLARALFLQPNMKHLKYYYQVESEAQEEKRGIWSLPEFKIIQSQKAEQCLKRFCRLQGKVKRVEIKRNYTYLILVGGVRVAVHNKNLEQFRTTGIDVKALKGISIVVRGWVGTRKGTPYLHLQHPLQINLM